MKDVDFATYRLRRKTSDRRVAVSALKKTSMVGGGAPVLFLFIFCLSCVCFFYSTLYMCFVLFVYSFGESTLTSETVPP